MTGFIDWAVEGGGGWLLGVRTEDSYPLQRLRMALEGAGAVSRELPAEAVLSGDELTARAVWLLEDVGAKPVSGRASRAPTPSQRRAAPWERW